MCHSHDCFGKNRMDGKPVKSGVHKSLWLYWVLLQNMLGLCSNIKELLSSNNSQLHYAPWHIHRFTKKKKRNDKDTVHVCWKYMSEQVGYSILCILYNSIWYSIYTRKTEALKQYHCRIIDGKQNETVVCAERCHWKPAASKQRPCCVGRGNGQASRFSCTPVLMQS